MAGKARGVNQSDADSSFMPLDALNFIEEQTKLFALRGIIQGIDHVIMRPPRFCGGLAKSIKVLDQLGEFREVKCARSVTTAGIKVDRSDYRAFHAQVPS